MKLSDLSAAQMQEAYEYLARKYAELAVSLNLATSEDHGVEIAMTWVDPSKRPDQMVQSRILGEGTVEFDDFVVKYRYDDGWDNGMTDDELAEMKASVKAGSRHGVVATPDPDADLPAHHGEWNVVSGETEVEDVTLDELGGSIFNDN